MIGREEVLKKIKQKLKETKFVYLYDYEIFEIINKLPVYDEDKFDYQKDKTVMDLITQNNQDTELLKECYEKIIVVMNYLQGYDLPVDTSIIDKLKERLGIE